MDNVAQIWARLNIQPGVVLDHSDDRQSKDLEFIKSFADKVGAKEGLPPVVKKSSDSISGSIAYLLQSKEPPEVGYLNLITSLLQIYLDLVMGKDFEKQSAAANEIIDKLATLHKAFVTQAPSQGQATFSKKFLGHYLIDLGFITQEQMDQALDDQKNGLYPGKRLGDILQDKEIITRAQLDKAIEEQMVDNME